MKILPVAFLRECFDCEFDTGALTWRVRPRSHFSSERAWNSNNARQSGRAVAPTLNNRGYRVVGLTYSGCASIFLQHRVVYSLWHGSWPEAVIDHINGDKQNNSIANLRCCSMLQNMANQRLTTGPAGRLKGTCFHSRLRRWSASICVNYKKQHLGYFETAEDAHQAYRAAATRLYGEFARFA